MFRTGVLLVVRNMKVDRVSLSFDGRLGLGSCRGVVGNVYFSISNGFVEERQEVGWLVTSADVSMVEVEDMAIGVVSVGAKLNGYEERLP